MPGHTHVQPAQPVLFAHHLLAYVEMLERDRGRFADAAAPGGRLAAGLGGPRRGRLPLDREAVAAELGFAGVTRNSIDAVGDRDFVVETLAAAALAMTHLSRLAEELVWWSNPAFGFLRLADAWSTGSSMMPNKRNPDPAELIRGRTARVIGHLVAVLTLLKGLPGGYQRDLQEDKPPLFDALAVLESSLRVMTGVVATLHVDEARMRAAATTGYTTATAVADALVERGVPFREAHHIVGTLVARAEAAGVELTGLDDADIARRPRRVRRTRWRPALADGCRACPTRCARPPSWRARSPGRTSSAARRPGGCTPSWRRPPALARHQRLTRGRSGQAGSTRSRETLTSPPPRRPRPGWGARGRTASTRCSRRRRHRGRRDVARARGRQRHVGGQACPGRCRAGRRHRRGHPLRSPGRRPRPARRAGPGPRARGRSRWWMPPSMMATCAPPRTLVRTTRQR